VDKTEALKEAFKQADGRVGNDGCVDHMFNKQGDRVNPDEVLAGKEVAIFYAGEFCPSCRNLTPKLREFFDKRNREGRPLALIFLSADQDEEAALAHFQRAHGDWFRLGFHDPLATSLKKRYLLASRVPHEMKLLSPEGEGVSQSVSEVILPSASGQLGVLANHAPMMTALDIGVLRYKQDGTWKPLVVLGGFASVDSNILSILVNDFATVDDIDLDTAKSDMEDAKLRHSAACQSPSTDSPQTSFMYSPTTVGAP